MGVDYITYSIGFQASLFRMWCCRVISRKFAESFVCSPGCVRSV